MPVATGYMNQLSSEFYGEDSFPNVISSFQAEKLSQKTCIFPQGLLQKWQTADLSDLIEELAPQAFVCRAALWLSAASPHCKMRAQRQCLLPGLSLPLPAQQPLCHGKVNSCQVLCRTTILALSC